MKNRSTLTIKSLLLLFQFFIAAVQAMEDPARGQQQQPPKIYWEVSHKVPTLKKLCARVVVQNKHRLSAFKEIDRDTSKFTADEIIRVNDLEGFLLKHLPFPVIGLASIGDNDCFCAFSQSGSSFALGCNSRVIINNRRSFMTGSPVKTLSWNFQADVLAAGCQNGKIFFIDIAQEPYDISGLQSSDIYYMAFNPCNNNIALVRSDGKDFIVIYGNYKDLDKNGKSELLYRSSEAIKSIEWKKNGKDLLIVRDKSYLVRPIEQPQITKFNVSRELVQACWTPDSKYVVTVDNENQIYFMNNQGECTKIINCDKFKSIESIALIDSVTNKEDPFIALKLYCGDLVLINFYGDDSITLLANPFGLNDEVSPHCLHYCKDSNKPNDLGLIFFNKKKVVKIWLPFERLREVLKKATLEDALSLCFIVSKLKKNRLLASNHPTLNQMSQQIKDFLIENLIIMPVPDQGNSEQ